MVSFCTKNGGIDMQKWSFRRPNAGDIAQIADYRQAFLDAGDSMDGTGPLRRMADPTEWVTFALDGEDPARVPPGLVQATQFLCVRGDGRVLGMLQVRHRFNDVLEKYGGHIGYSVHPAFRRQGVAKWMLAQALPYCREIGLTRVLVTCKAGNEGSRRTIQSNGGVYESTVHEPQADVDLERWWIALG